MNTFLHLFLLFIILVSCCIFSPNNNRESFVPKKVKEMYRPLARNFRISYEGFYDKSSLDLSNLFRKVKII